MAHGPLVFNRKRIGEAEWITVKSFHATKSGGQIESVVKTAPLEINLQSLKNSYTKPIFESKSWGKEEEKFLGFFFIINKGMQMKIGILFLFFF